MTRFLPFGSRSKTIQVNTLGAGGAPAVTYATWNPADKASGITLSNGNLTAVNASGAWNDVRSTISKSSGKWYWETTYNTSNLISLGIGNTSANLLDIVGGDTNSWSLYGGQFKVHNGDFVVYGARDLVAGDIVSTALDLDAGTLTYYLNGVSMGQAYTGLTGTLFAMVGSINSNQITTNFGATPFAYSVPSGYNAGLYT